jgi:hypothetical protein
MIRMKQILILNTLLWLLLLSNIACSKNNLPQLYLFLGGDEASSHTQELNNPFVYGAQIVYSWKQLEPKKGTYNFSKIEKDLNFLSLIHKKLFIQLQDRSFEPTIFNVPDYIRNDVIYHGGVAMQYDYPGEGKPITSGWVARVWDPAVRERYQLLMQKLAAHFDGKITGINLPETAVDFDINNPPKDFTYDNYFYAEIENIIALRQAFQKSIVIQYVNFFPGEWNNDHHYMSKLFSYALKYHFGLGGPDVVPYRMSHMKNSFPFFHKFKGKLLTGIAIQEPDYTYKNPDTGDYYRFSDFYSFSRDYLGAKIIFWNTQEPFFSTQLLPNLNTQYFECARY